ncbi:MAG: ABC transporter ATP-binding protein [Clostridia bacterium]|nr:ABC transporter ATP-binding protein [Clostridia bacterium]
MIDFGNVEFIKIAFLTEGVSFLRLIAALMPSLQTLAVAGLLDALPGALSNGRIMDVSPPLLALLAVMLGSYLIQALNRFLMLELSMRLEDRLKPEFVARINRLTYEYIENDETYDLLERVGADLPGTVEGGFVNLLDLAEISLRVLGPIVIIGRSSVPAAGTCLLLIIPIAAFAQKSGKEAYKASAQIAPHARKAKYLNSLISSREAASERKLFGFGAKINEYWNHEIHQKITLDYSADKRIFIRAKSISVLFTLLLFVIALILILIVRQNLMTAGAYISLIITFSHLIHTLSWQFSDLLKEYVQKRLYLEDLSRFEQLAEEPGNDSAPDRRILSMLLESLVFEHVSFTYPQSDREVLHDFCLTIYPRKQYAFVGQNGCGKSTVVKLLTGLYKSYSGRILLNGRDIKSFSAAEIKAYFAVVYQDYAKYQLLVREELQLGNPDLTDPEIVALLEQTGLERKVESFPRGVETPLGKLEPGSVDLSEGQWQRLALARSFGREAKLLVLDEPAAALDALAESRIYHIIRNIGIRRYTSTLYVTHRLAAARSADEIIVMNDGRIIEQGTHAALLAMNSYYAEMFNTQRKWYLKKKVAEA